MPANTASLRPRLRVLRRDALARLAAGMLELVAHTGAVLAAIAEPPVQSDRCIISDDGREIAITAYSADRRCAAAVLSPLAALRLAAQLVAAGLRRL
jgi:hypothetical protein